MPHDYDVSLHINTVAETLDARVRLDFQVHKPGSVVRLLLYRGLQPGSVTCPGLLRYSSGDEAPYYPFCPDASVLRLDLVHALKGGERLLVDVAYDGRIPTTTWGVNRLTREWIELGLYAPWFPYDPESGPFTFRVRLNIDEEYSVLGLGSTTRNGRTWTLRSPTPMNDMVILAAPKMREFRCAAKSSAVRVFYTDLTHESNAGRIRDLAGWLLQFYGDWLGSVNGYRQVTIVGAPRSQGGGYARPGLIVLSSLSNFDPLQPSRLRYLAHELAHLWWFGAPVDSWEDWLNESFAEYCALAAVAARLGADTREQLLSDKRQAAQGLPPIEGVERAAEHTHAVLYEKGPLLVADLEQRLGTSQFTQLLRKFLGQQVKNTVVFLETLAGVAGRSEADWFQEQLRC